LPRVLDVEGFSLTLLRQGSRSVVSTLWETIDASAPRFFEAFYAQRPDVSTTPSVALAVQSAQLELLSASGGPSRECFAHPADWGPYVVTAAAVA
jgi:CHAT domain-containing protein